MRRSLRSFASVGGLEAADGGGVKPDEAVGRCKRALFWGRREFEV